MVNTAIPSRLSTVAAGQLRCRLAQPRAVEGRTPSGIRELAMIGKVWQMIGQTTKVQIAGLIVLNIFSAFTESIGIGAIFVAIKVSIDPGSISGLPFARLVAGGPEKSNFGAATIIAV